MKTFLLALTLALFLPATSYADVDCSDVKSKNQAECVRAKANNNNGNNRGSNIDCSDVKNSNRDDCIKAKRNNNDNDLNIDKDDVNCSKIDDQDARRRCLQKKY